MGVGVGVAAGDVVWDGVTVGLGDAPNDSVADGEEEGVEVLDTPTSSGSFSSIGDAFEDVPHPASPHNPVSVTTMCWFTPLSPPT